MPFSMRYPKSTESWCWATSWATARIHWASSTGSSRLKREPFPEGTDWIEVPSSALVNPGSVGQPRDGNPDAAFAVVDLSRPAVRFERVPYDIATTQAKIRAAGLPEVEAARLALGR